MTKALLSFIFSTIFSVTANAEIMSAKNELTWVKGAYIVGIQPNCMDKQKVRISWSDKPSGDINLNNRRCTQFDLNSPLNRGILALAQSAMLLKQRVDIHMTPSYINDIIVRAD